MKNTKLQKYYPWIVVALLWVVALLNYMDRQMLSTMRESMQVDIAELEEAVNFGRLMAIFLWIYGLVSPVAGAVADRISRKWLIVGSLGVWSAVRYWPGCAAKWGFRWRMMQTSGAMCSVRGKRSRRSVSRVR